MINVKSIILRHFVRFSFYRKNNNAKKNEISEKMMIYNERNKPTIIIHFTTRSKTSKNSIYLNIDKNIIFLPKQR